ncbi:unnamed protein product [Moneuplotes crassus]|uniref:PB1 domain-containing protein n=1 Tax=Euplotes crassus TaxID=5936 RepID=A0AAD1U1I6_EUPCR|nr:unnamed protein product [Moneuplotes crassus]
MSMTTKTSKENPEIKLSAHKDDDAQTCGSQESLIDFKQLAEDIRDNTVLIKISFRKSHRYLDDSPKSMKELKKQIETIFDTKFERKWRMFYFDSQSDRIDVTKNRDLKTAYKVGSNKKDKVLKIFVWDKEGPLPEHKDTKKTTFVDSALEQKKMIDNMHQQNLPPYSSAPKEYVIKKAPDEPTRPTLDKMRENSIHPQFFIKEESKTQTQPEFDLMKLQMLSKEDMNYLSTLKHRIVEVIKVREDVPFEEIESEFAQDQNYQRLKEIASDFIHHIIAKTKEKVRMIRKTEVLPDMKPSISALMPQPRFDPNLVVTSARTSDDKNFGRAFFSCRIGSSFRSFAFFVSEFEIKALKSNKNTGQNLYLETCLECSEGVYKEALTLKILDFNCKVYLPIVHCVIEEPCKESYLTFFNWCRQELGTFLTPKTIIVDFKYDLFQAVKEAYHNIQVVVCFNKMTKKFYQLAEQYHLIQEKLVAERVRRLILALKCLAFSIPGGVKDIFEKIRGEHSKEFMDLQEQYGSFMSYINTTYCDRFSKIDWWNQNHAKLVFPEEIKLASHSDEILSPVYAKYSQELYNAQNPGENNIQRYITALQGVEKATSQDIYNKYAPEEGKEVQIEARPFTKTMKALMEEELDKIFNCEENNEGLCDTAQALETIGLKLEVTEKGKEEFKPECDLNPCEEETTGQN